MNHLLEQLAGKQFSESELTERQELISVFSAIETTSTEIAETIEPLADAFLEILAKGKKRKKLKNKKLLYINEFLKRVLSSKLFSIPKRVIGVFKGTWLSSIGKLFKLITLQFTKLGKIFHKIKTSVAFLVVASLGILVLSKRKGSISSKPSKRVEPKSDEEVESVISEEYVPQPTIEIPPIEVDLPEITAKTIQYAGSDAFAYTATPAQISHMRTLATEVLMPLQSSYGKPIKVTSGFRSLQHNIKVGGSKTSYHLQGYAADITAGSREENKKLFELVYKSGKFTELIWEDNGRWVHVAYTGVSTQRVRRMDIVNEKQRYRDITSLSDIEIPTSVLYSTAEAPPQSKSIYSNIVVTNYSTPL